MQLKETSQKTTLSSQNQSYALEVNGLVKKFNRFTAVDNISFTVRSGEIFGFLGPNGAGKTTTIKSILDLIHADSGDIKINGIDIKKNIKDAKKFVGYLPEKVAFYDNLTGLQNLQFYAQLKKASSAECQSLMKEFGLQDAMHQKVGTYSKGMNQRLGMARALLGSPPLLILDEPSGGLDPRGVILIREKIVEMKKKGTTIFISSHILSEIQSICDRVGIINKGILVAKDSVSVLSKMLQLKPKLTLELETISDDIVNTIKSIQGIDSVQIINKIINVVCNPSLRSKVVVAIENAGGNIINLHTTEPSLEEVFLRFTEGKQ
ncbi:MAG: ABC transporter ATP-binding protein [Thermoplasmatota archaeon]